MNRSIFDASATYRIDRYSLKAGMNNIGDKKYFSLRADESRTWYIPSIGRSFYIDISAKF